MDSASATSGTEVVSPDSASVRGTDVLFERRGPVAWVTFNRPESRNAMTFAMYEGLVEACERADGDDSVRVMVLRGAGNRVGGRHARAFNSWAGLSGVAGCPLGGPAATTAAQAA